MKDNYWVDFWKNYTANNKENDEQSQVLRTLNKKPISNELWGFTLNEIDKNFIVSENDSVLDLCSGNGLLSKHFVAKGAKVTAVDVSDELLKNLIDTPNVKTISSDIRLLDFNDNTFDKIIIYAGIQYLTNKEVVALIKKMHRWLKPIGELYIGDIPNSNKLWAFYNNEKRQEVYFNNLLEGKSIVGNWFEKEWFDKLTNYIGFSNGEFFPQNEKLIYANFRFDYCYKKR